MFKELRDRENNLLGTIRTRLTGDMEIRDERGVLRGLYDPIRDVTSDASGRFFGRGNLLALFLKGE